MAILPAFRDINMKQIQQNQLELMMTLYKKLNIISKSHWLRQYVVCIPSMFEFVISGKGTPAKEWW